MFLLVIRDDGVLVFYLDLQVIPVTIFHVRVVRAVNAGYDLCQRKKTWGETNVVRENPLLHSPSSTSPNRCAMNCVNIDMEHI